MKSEQLSVPLSHLVPSRRNPRKVRPSQQSNQCLVALIRALGLLQPLVVRPLEGKPKHYEVVAGHRRLKALREIHRGDGDPRIPCILCDLDAVSADAVSLGENFGREAMHPLDEAEAFAKLAADEAKGVEVVAAEFGVPERYVRQRLKLATLADIVKIAYRDGAINTATAEAFASVPQAKQTEVWTEINGQPRHAEHVRNVIANDWIDATRALFDPSSLPEAAVSGDLFSEKVLVERSAFMAAQSEALLKERQAMIESGWSNVVAGRFGEVDQPMGMDVPQREFDPETAAKLEKLGARQQKLEAKLAAIPEDDEAALAQIQTKFDSLESEERDIVEHAPPFVSEATKSVATAFLILQPDGQVRREYRIPRQRRSESVNGNGYPSDRSGDGSAASGHPTPPTSDDLGDKQLAVTFTHQALAVREALLKNVPARKRILALLLHDKVRPEALAVRHDANSTTLCANADGFTSAALDRLQERRRKLDPLVDQHMVEDQQAYQQLGELSGAKLDALTDLLIVECVTAHLQRRTELVQHLANELKVNVRDDWRPDAAWLAGFQKIQLAHLITDLMGPVHAPAPERKKSALIESLSQLFSDAAEGKLEDKALADRVNRWLPSNLREGEEAAATDPGPEKKE